MQIPPHDQSVHKKMKQNLEDSRVNDGSNDNRKVIYSSACKDSPGAKVQDNKESLKIEFPSRNGLPSLSVSLSPEHRTPTKLQFIEVDKKIDALDL